MYLIMVCGMFVWCSLCVSVFMLTASNALLMSSATVIVRCFIAMVLLMLCSAVVVVYPLQ